MTIIRVFPRRTSFTPRDTLAFVGDPPLWKPAADEVHVSVTFTWDVEEGRRLAEAWAQHYPVVQIGGPAFGSAADGFTPGVYVKQGVTFTSRGCNNRCPWCLVPEREGKLKLLPIVPGWIIQDNNILATPREHQEQVYAMLRQQPKAAVFSGGLEARLVDDWVAGQFRTLRIASVFLAADTDGALGPLREAAQRLSFLPRNKLRCYVLMGRESIEDAQARLRAVWKAGCMPFAQLYQPPDRRILYSAEWRSLARTWSRPAAMRFVMREREGAASGAVEGVSDEDCN